MQKAITIYCNVSIVEDILDIFKEVDIKNYTQWPRLDNHVWPGANSGFQVIVREDMATKLMDRLQELRDSEAGRQSGIYAFQTAVERSLN